jgi:hypothetical protein
MESQSVSRIVLLRDSIKAISENPSFIHHEWFFPYHIEIVEKITAELCLHYPKADKELVQAMVLMHDFGKMVDFPNQYNATVQQGPAFLKTVGYDDVSIQHIIQNIVLIDKKLEVNLGTAPIEVQIVSSADGCSHFVGPFMYLWWHENHQKSYKQLMEDNVAKANKDWNFKIVLPEARQAFEGRYRQLLEQCGAFPPTFIP